VAVAVGVLVGGGVLVRVAVSVIVGVGVPVRVKVMVQVFPGYPQGVFVDVGMDPAGKGATEYSLLQASGKNKSEETISTGKRNSNFDQRNLVPTGHPQTLFEKRWIIIPAHGRPGGGNRG
jgi:hypothetical protein